MEFYPHNWDNFLFRSINYNMIIFNDFPGAISEEIWWQNKRKASLKDFLRVSVKMAKKYGWVNK